MKDKLQLSAEKQNIDGVDWIRQAIQEKLDREEHICQVLTDEELNTRIERIMSGMLSEMFTFESFENLQKYLKNEGIPGSNPAAKNDED